MRNSWILSGLLAAALVTPAAANNSADDAWLAWVGCWRAEGDASQRALCIVPDGNGVRMITLNGNAVQSESRIIADGQPHAISQEGCSGTETARWSEDRKRLFINADLNCGNNTQRNVSSIWAMLNRSQWANVQSIGAGDDRMLNTVRYAELELTDLPAEIAQAFADNRLARETIRLSAAAPLDLGDVHDAVQQAETRAVEAWLTVVGQEFNLNGQKLIALADAGVPNSVIDVLVALSNPQHFAVREERATDAMPRGRRPVGCLDSYWYDPYDPFAYRGGRFARNYYNTAYGCGGMGGWGFYPTWGGYYGGGRVIVIAPVGEARGRGKVTRNGYRAPRDTGVGTPSTTRTNTSSGSTRSSGDAAAGSGSSSSSDGGRKAKPRDN